MILTELKSRLIGAHIRDMDLYNTKGQRTQRLYINYGARNSYLWTYAWLEVVNDKLSVFVQVERRKKINGKKEYDTELAKRYKREIEKEFYEIINDCELERLKIPLHERLRDDVTPVYENSMLHQADALRFLCSMKVSALFADPGVGKSKVVIDLCISRYKAGQIKKVLVFCPVSTIQNFQEQIDTWCTCSALEWKIMGTESMSNSPTAMFDAIDFVDNETQVIIDESHLIKAAVAKRSKRILYCANKTSYKLVMTGTPTEHLKDLYMQYAMLSELIIKCNSYYGFEERHLIMGGPTRNNVIGYKNVEYLMGLVSPYTYQIKKEKCLKIPAKTFTEIRCDLNVRQRELYDMQKESLLKFIGRGDNVEASKIFGYLIRMQQICCGFYRDPYTKEIEDLKTEKLELLRETSYYKGQTIFFCKYLYEVELLTKYLGAEKCAVFTGKNKRWRNEEKYYFQVQNKQYFVCTMSSGGVGLNGLQVCSRGIFFSYSFKSIERAQSIARIDRYGQKHEMDMWDMLTTAGIDEKIKKNVKDKTDLANEIRDLLYDRTQLKKFIEEL